jgi:hypothetical protein
VTFGITKGDILGWLIFLAIWIPLYFLIGRPASRIMEDAERRADDGHEFTKEELGHYWHTLLVVIAYVALVILLYFITNKIGRILV